MNPYRDLTYLDVRLEAGIAVVSMAGGRAGNALSVEGHTELSEILPRLGRDDRVDAIVLRGAGDEFCVGPTQEFMDRVRANDPAFVQHLMRDVRAIVQSHIDLDKPVVTALNGTTSGGALAFALFADIVVAERHVVLSDPHVPAGVAAGDGGVLIWPLALGLLRAKRFLYTGDPLPADEALALGLVTEVVERGEAVARAMHWANRLAAMPRSALRHTKRAMNQWLRIGLPAFDASWAGEILTVNLPDDRPR
ncbi:MAG: enoyl-CoA hydratase/isomerase family protein [Deltaproteobacteria bacterium]|nr:enoyl-CoA hydratase/isomerase family protein [Deltaproteobacteria bacterium]